MVARYPIHFPLGRPITARTRFSPFSLSFRRGEPSVARYPIHFPVRRHMTALPSLAGAPLSHTPPRSVAHNRPPLTSHGRPLICPVIPYTSPVRWHITDLPHFVVGRPSVARYPIHFPFGVHMTALPSFVGAPLSQILARSVCTRPPHPQFVGAPLSLYTSPFGWHITDLPSFRMGDHWSPVIPYASHSGGQ